MLKNFFLFGTITTTSIMPFAQVSPESVSGWEKLGIVGILLGAIAFLIFERRVQMKELTAELVKLTAEMRKLKSSVRRLTRCEESRSQTFSSSAIITDIQAEQDLP